MLDKLYREVFRMAVESAEDRIKQAPKEDSRDLENAISGMKAQLKISTIKGLKIEHAHREDCLKARIVREKSTQKLKARKKLGRMLQLRNWLRKAGWEECRMRRQFHDVLKKVGIDARGQWVESTWQPWDPQTIMHFVEKVR